MEKSDKIFSNFINTCNTVRKIDEENICDNKTFWKIVKPMLSKKIKSNEKITLIENDEIIKTEKRTVKVLNAFFLNIV